MKIPDRVDVYKNKHYYHMDYRILENTVYGKILKKDVSMKMLLDIKTTEEGELESIKIGFLRLFYS